MASFLFAKAPERIAKNNFSLSSGSLTGVLVTATPSSPTLETFGQLSNLVTGGNYSHKQLLIPNNDSNQAVVTRTGGGVKILRTSPTWESLSTVDNAPITGMVLVEGSSIFSSSFLVAYLERVEGTTPTPFVPNGSDTLLFSLMTNGFLEVY